MKDGYRQQLAPQQLDRMLAAAGVDPGLVRSRTELGDANFNTVYRVELGGTAADHSSLVLKVAPHPNAPTLSYERGIMRTEAMYYQAMAGLAPVPEVVHAGFTRNVIASDFLVLTGLPGTNWHAGQGRFGDGDRARLRSELGRLVAALHQVTGTGFGYPQIALYPSWKTAFFAMLDAVLTDADVFASTLPEPPARIRESMWAWADLLDAVTIPVLVHFDLWDGNILVDLSTGQPRISGLVDGERAFWGDPLADLVSLGLFHDIEQDEPFLSGYRSAGGRVSFDAATRLRLALYRCYLYLIMLVEAAPRGSSGPDHQQLARYVNRGLRAELAKLSAAKEPW